MFRRRLAAGICAVIVTGTSVLGVQSPAAAATVITSCANPSSFPQNVRQIHFPDGSEATFYVRVCLTEYKSTDEYVATTYLWVGDGDHDFPYYNAFYHFFVDVSTEAYAQLAFHECDAGNALNTTGAGFTAANPYYCADPTVASTAEGTIYNSTSIEYDIIGDGHSYFNWAVASSPLM